MIKKNKTPHLYLDMDGVQCNFYKKLADENNYSDYKDVPYLESLVTDLAYSSPKYVFDFFANLELMPNGLKLINFVKANRIPFTILSAPLHGQFTKFSILGKKAWLDKYVPGASENAIFTSEKYLYATYDGEPNILVDDLDHNIRLWRQYGGIAIKHDDSTMSNTISELQKIYGIHK